MSQPLLSDEILEANGDVWRAMQEHRFVLDIGQDRLDPRVFRRYLAYENAFVETAITIFGYLLVKAPGLTEQRWMISGLKALSEEQITYFREAFADSRHGRRRVARYRLAHAGAGLRAGYVGHRGAWPLHRRHRRDVRRGVDVPGIGAAPSRSCRSQTPSFDVGSNCTLRKSSPHRPGG